MDGLWIANFSAGAAHGSGILVLHSGELIGGDFAHTYKGSWNEDGPSLNARVRVEPWTAQEQSETGSREAPFMMTLTGTSAENVATLHGHPDDRPELFISVEMKRAA